MMLKTTFQLIVNVTIEIEMMLEVFRIIFLYQHTLLFYFTLFEMVYDLFNCFLYSLGLNNFYILPQRFKLNPILMGFLP